MILAIFFKNLRSIKECDGIKFYKSKKLSREILVECLSLYITPMIEGWKIKRTLVDNGLAINACSHNFLIQLQEKGIKIPPLHEFIF